jgi:hypothetical protein
MEIGDRDTLSGEIIRTLFPLSARAGKKDRTPETHPFPLILPS